MDLTLLENQTYIILNIVGKLVFDLFNGMNFKN